MPIQAVETQRLYRQIANQLVKLIESGEYKPRERLPPERDLAKRLGVSRPSLREALIALEVEGYVEVRVGSGVYVTNSGKGAGRPLPLPPDSGPFDVMQARRIIETECAGMAAEEATLDQIRGIEEAYEAMYNGETDVSPMPLVTDRLFHMRIAEASGNSALALAVKILWDQRIGPLFSQLENHFDNPETWRAAAREHRDIVKAIAKHNPTAARTAMRIHLDKSTKRLRKS
jgi:DNA-binding FadR family transcriptional regulator